MPRGRRAHAQDPLNIYTHLPHHTTALLRTEPPYEHLFFQNRGLVTDLKIHFSITHYSGVLTLSTFLRKRAPWDYKRIATAPPGTFK